LEKSQPGITHAQFKYGLSRSKYHKEWGKNYRAPGIGTYALAVVIKIFPKIGVMRILKFKSPTQPAEELFIKSFNHTVLDYSAMLKKCGNNALHLDNINFDTGKKTAVCEYSLVDDTYKELLLKLQMQPDDQVNEHLRNNILDFYRNFSPTVASEKEGSKCFDALAWLKSRQ
jgi:hypothetical protein